MYYIPRTDDDNFSTNKCNFDLSIMTLQCRVVRFNNKYGRLMYTVIN